MVEEPVDRRSGLQGISGIGGDTPRLSEAASSKPGARLAIDMFCYSVRKQIAAMIAALGGVDLIVFTGGTGENDAKTRAAIGGGMFRIGIGVDEGRNILVLPLQEEEQLARHTYALLR
jgi:acetate kinase